MDPAIPKRQAHYVMATIDDQQQMQTRYKERHDRHSIGMTQMVSTSIYEVSTLGQNMYRIICPYMSVGSPLTEVKRNNLQMPSQSRTNNPKSRCGIIAHAMHSTPKHHAKKKILFPPPHYKRVLFPLWFRRLFHLRRLHIARPIRNLRNLIQRIEEIE